MEFIIRFMLLIWLIGVLLPYLCKAQSPARSLDALLQDYAFRSFHHPHTGIIYDGTVPNNLTGIKIAALRLRNGSLKKRGFANYKEFTIPTGIVVRPYVQRLVLVYQNLGNWSSFYYPLPGYTYLAPVLGLLAYDAANLSATHLPELDIVASKSPILIEFTDVSPVPNGVVAKCVWFNINGTAKIGELEAPATCSTNSQGHFSVVINSSAIPPPPAPAPAPAPGTTPVHKSHSKVWKIVGGVVGGFLGLILLALLVVWIHRYLQEKRTAKMIHQSETGIPLQMVQVGNFRMPQVPLMRTQPQLEDEYIF
ncbi:uncharacterized protein LOC109719184 [Ananas comosus]|uniref:Uncharacterized protein LOC109719184 n=1 Tax=Ananas comosus TaxID=4615 RepID=A0A6P5G0F9_ANACO|nr:uncharacterized protein LOC109719184 [Ananas comosus]